MTDKDFVLPRHFPEVNKKKLNKTKIKAGRSLIMGAVTRGNQPLVLFCSSLFERDFYKDIQVIIQLTF